VLGAEVEHLLRLREAADERARQPPVLEDEVENVGRGMRLSRRADEGHGAVALEKDEVGVEVVRSRDGVEDEVEAVDVLLHGIGVLRYHDLVGAEAQAVLGLARGGGEQHHVGTHGMGQLHGNVPEAAET
jgi:hypothetical protein